jgi:cytochrome c oxidase cbb3-type subunit IV
MDINTLRGISTLLVLLAFLGLCVWAYSRRRKPEFDAAAQLPFADESTQPREPESRPSTSQEHRT